MSELLLFQKILLSLAIGALIGIEREKRGKGELFAGVRTFMLICLFGLLVAHISLLLNTALPIYFGLFSIAGFTIVSYIFRYNRTKSVGLTTEVAFLITFLIGLILFYEPYPYFLSISLGVMLTLILLSKESLHSFAKHLKKKEIRDAVIFAIAAFVILPILPNKPVDPFGAINPYIVWLSVVLVLTISFAGYVAMKILGVKKGLALTGLFGGLASSTAVSISMAEKVKENKRILYSAVFAVVLASSTMFLRQVLVTSFFNFDLAILLVLPLLALAFIGYVLSYFPWKKISKAKTLVKIGSPIALTPALKFAVFFTIILFISHLAKQHLGLTGIFLVALIAGLIDVDAITISIASLATFSPALAAPAIILAGISNTFSKWFLINWLGNKRMSIEVGKIFSVIIVAGLLFLLLFGC